MGAETVTCTRCRVVAPQAAKFCASCGTPLQPPVVDVRKTVTALFCDVTESTALGERLDPEALRAVIESYFATVAGILARHGGTVEKFVGDAVMGVFGIPTAHEDDALRAARAALETLAAVAELDRAVSETHGARLQVRIGVETGEVLVGDPARGSTFASGDAINTAARLEQAAGPGETLIGARTLRLVRHLVKVEERPGLTLKGKAGAVTAYRLVGLVEAEAEAHARSEAPLVGRSRELGLLHQAFDRAVVDRTCQLATVLGVAGVGKTRLVAEFLASLASVAGLDPAATVLRGRCVSYGEGITYWPLVEVVREAAGLVGTEPESVARARLGAVLEGEPEAAAIVERIAPVTGLGGTPTTPGDTAWAVQRLVEALAAVRPVVLVIDDLHWAEPGLLDILESVCDWSRDAAVLVIALARPEFLDTYSGWGAGKVNSVTALLEPLNDAEIDTLAAELLGGALPPDLAERVRRAAGGNPLYVEQLLAMLCEDGRLVEDDRGWHATGAVHELEVPPSISALLTARLDRLNPIERSVLGAASVIGPVFYPAAVVELTDSPESEVNLALRALIRTGLLRPDRSDLPGQNALRFAHVSVRDTAYGALPKVARSPLHEGFARWLDKHTAGQAYDDFVGGHLEAAYRSLVDVGMLDAPARALGTEAAARLESAGRTLLYADDASAAALLERTLALRADEGPARWELEIDLADALERAGHPRRVAEFAGRVRSAAAPSNDERWISHAELRLARARQQTHPEGATETLQRQAEQALTVFSRLGDDVGSAQAHLALGDVAMMAAQFSAADHHLQVAARHADQAGLAQLAEYTRRIALGSLVLGTCPAEAGLAESRARSAVADERRVKASTAIVVGFFATLLGRTEEAREAKELAERLAVELRSPWVVSGLAMALGGAELTAGELQEALRLMAWGCRELTATGDAAHLSTLAALNAHAHLHAGDVDSARTEVRVALESGSVDDMSTRALAAAALSWLAALDGDPTASRQHAEGAVRLAETTDQLEGQGLVHVACAEAARIVADPAASRRYREAAIDRFAAKGNVVAVARQRAQL